MNTADRRTPGESRPVLEMGDTGFRLLSRREAIVRGFTGLASSMLAGNSLAPLLAAAPAKAKSIIQIWLWGGACHLDTFDPKPEAGPDYCGPLTQPIATNVDGLRIGELLPQLAKQADKYCLIRSMTHGNDGHETASYMVQTGRTPGGREVYPSAAAVVALFKGGEDDGSNLVKPYIILTQPQGRFSEAGFLGTRCKPFATGGDPARTPFLVEGIVAPGISEKRQQARRQLLKSLNTLEHRLKGNAELAKAAHAEKQAYDMILGDGAKLFDLAQEKTELRDRYGRSTFGQSCLMARRLVEHGVSSVTINFEGWDTHKQHFPAMRRKLPELDKGLASLLLDLSERGLLDSTIIWCCGEFGRTPRVQWEAPWNGGRGHYGKVFSALLAGGGVKGGRVVGQSDAKGEAVRERPVYPLDVIGAIYELMGIPADAKLPHPQGLDARVLPPASENALTGGRLKEIL